MTVVCTKAFISFPVIAALPFVLRGGFHVKLQFVSVTYLVFCKPRLYISSTKLIDGQKR